MAANDLPRFLHLSEVCEWLGIAKPTVYRWIRTASFPSPIHIGIQARVWRQDEIERWIESRDHGRKGLKLLVRK